MESIRVERLMESVFAFCQRYILHGLFPSRLLQTHMEVICLNSLGEKKIRGGALFWGLEISLRGLRWMLLGLMLKNRQTLFCSIYNEDSLKN